MMNETTRHIDLKVPTGWNQCSAEQLETVAAIILRRTAMQDRYHPYDPLQMKTEAFFALANLEVVEAEGEDALTNGRSRSRSDDTMQASVAALSNATFSVRQRAHTGDRNPVTSKISQLFQSPCAPFPLAVWQVHSFIDQHLKWLDDFTGLLLFPYHDLGHYWTLDRHWPFAHRHRLGFDGELLDGMTWQEYRFAQEWLNYYVDVNDKDIKEALRARTEFLRAVYRLPDGHYPRALRRMSPARFQVILIWWQSMMREMQKKYRRCFTKGKNGQSSMVRSTSGRSQGENGQSSLPIDLYTRSTATLQDKYHLTEEQINLQPCRVILQHLEDMAHEAEELERIQRQNKSHKH